MCLNHSPADSCSPYAQGSPCSRGRWERELGEPGLTHEIELKFTRRTLGLLPHWPRLLEACLHSLLSFLTSNFPSNPLLPDSLFSIERLSLRFKTWLAGPGDPVAVFVEFELLAIVLPWPVASSCAICCCAQVPRAAHLHRRAAGIAHRPCRLKKRSLRTPGRPARGPQEAQREDPTHDAQREDLTHNPPGLGQSHHLESCVGPWTHGHRHLPPGPSNCKSLHSHGDALHISCGTCWTQDSGPWPPLE
ncbi:uncharacterized protein LOC110306444 isoform X2 [Mus caroli]|uniref:Uncharacterized protein LOC110306444 isoform X2 n=1 Tax=Mus caroli TaxID=10089 RepID=A0A6P5QUF6_MUSCR|nr:uncharacterized protein LOC110306444 isoform X2 [Mus caroli]